MWAPERPKVYRSELGAWVVEMEHQTWVETIEFGTWDLAMEHALWMGLLAGCWKMS